MVAAVSKLMRNQDLMLVASRCEVVTRFRNTLGLPGHWRCACSPTTQPTARRALASTIDGLMYGAGDAVIGINPATDSVPALVQLLHVLDEVIQAGQIPTQTAC
jgi:ethanolamine ammonia-lyase large subunit